MTSKEEYSKKFNEMFTVEVDWTKLSKEDLIKLDISFANVLTQIENIKTKLTQVQSIEPERPIVNTIKKVISQGIEQNFLNK